MKETIREEVGTLSLSHWNGEKVINLINFLKEFKNPEELEIDYDYEDHFAHIRHTREETDEEYQTRIENERIINERYLNTFEDKERKEYERLKAKFES